MYKNKTNVLTQAIRQHLNIPTSLAISFVMASSTAVHAAVMPQIDHSKQHVLPGPALANRELMFIDSEVANPEQLLINLKPGIEAIILQPDQDGLEQITAVVNNRQNIAAIHIVAHGEAGQLHLGKLSLTSEELNKRAFSLQSWFAQASPAAEKPDLLLYACNLAQDGKGTAFVEQLALLTGTDVAASNDITGAGGDWDLEVHLGTIHTPNAFRPEDVADYPYRLATFTVTKNADTNDGTCDADCSLREAIAAAELAGGADIIALGAGVTGTITLTLGQISIGDDLTINGPGASTLAISGNNASRIFNLGSGPSTIVTIRDLTLRDGDAPGNGGAIGASLTTLTIEDSVITGNTTSRDGGGIYSDDGDVIIRRTEISNNYAEDSGGGIAFYMDGTDDLTVEDSLITGNEASYDGGGIWAYADDEGGTVTVTNSTISNNTAGASGDGGFGGGISFYSDDEGYLVVTDSTISGNDAAYDGGGIFFYSDDGALTITNSTISGNSASAGGGVFIQYSEGTNFNNSTIVFNTASDYGGGIMDEFTNASLYLENSIVADNTASFAPDVSSDNSNVAYSLIGDTEDTNVIDNGGNILDAASGVSPSLVNAGGLNSVHLLQAGSPAINAGAGASPLAFDQRGSGFPRILDGRLDMGAVEVAAAPIEPGEDIPIPTLPHWALLVLGLLLPSVALRYRRRLEGKKPGP